MYVSWTNYTTQLTASVVKEVVCEKCQTHYAYAIQTTQSGTGTSLYGIDGQGAADRSVGNAAAKLQSVLSGAFDLVPCPNCGTYQAEMVQFLKNSHLKWMAALGWLFIILALIFLIVTLASSGVVYAGTAVAFFLAGVGLIVYRNRSKAGFDPNEDDVEDRKKIGCARALRKEVTASTGQAPLASSGGTGGQSRRRRARL